MDETYIKVKGKWVYLYRAVDNRGDTLDFMLSERRDEDAATAFFKQATIMAFLIRSLWIKVGQTMQA
ncbi:transposase, putative [methanotrophic endosymbiont of Bathymodiolus azoricus (Menez Gwen)]|nr:transposase, putative [methanotrophic endosymbiont of Bathymodiolus azoricus (Menez Gwen)]